ncbi:hypothetical protein [Microcoleus sp. S36b_A4]|uniref:hypothetical protein n=1 Tax=Microcoleus sp. S36b_A4 TaxID=3055420 RepID=UPI002FCF26B7
MSSFALVSMVEVDRTREGNFTIQFGLFYPLPEIRTLRRAVSLQLIGRWLNLYSLIPFLCKYKLPFNF